MATTMTMNDYIKTSDLPGAYERFQNTTGAWKSRWWSVVEEIYNNCVKWAKYFAIDPINRVLKRLTRGRLPDPCTLTVESQLTYNVPAEGCGAYIVQHFDNKGKSLWIKCGKADNAKVRLEQHFTKDYYKQAFSGVVLGWFSCKNSNHALTAENIIRDHFQKKGYKLMGNDRFPSLSEITAEDFAEIERKLKIVEEIF